jgi:hypothetical protein
MASHRLAAVLGSTGQLAEEEINDMSEDEAWHWLHSNVSVQHQADDESFSAANTGTIMGKLLC